MDKPINTDFMDYCYENDLEFGSFFGVYKNDTKHIKKLKKNISLLEYRLSYLDRNDESNKLYIDLIEFMIETMNIHIESNDKFNIFDGVNQKVLDIYNKEYVNFLQEGLQIFKTKHL